MNKTLFTSLAFFVVAACPSVAAQGPKQDVEITSAKQALIDKDYRAAITYLCDVLISAPEKQVSRAALLKQLKQAFNGAGLAQKSSMLDKLKNSQKLLLAFLAEELSIANPSKSIEMFSDGTFLISDTASNALPLFRSRFTSCPNVVSGTPILITNPNYHRILENYWWYKPPTKEQMANLPKYIPPQAHEPNGAFSVK